MIRRGFGYMYTVVFAACAKTLEDIGKADGIWPMEAPGIYRFNEGLHRAYIGE